MIFATLKIRNPFHRERQDYSSHDYFCYDCRLSKHKNFETQLSKFSSFHLFEITLNTNWTGEDHGGLRFDIQIWRYFFSIGIYDSRHWNIDFQRWYRDDDEIE
jgi:hypothetical protein